MEVLDLGLIRPAILPPALVTTMTKVTKNNFLKFLWVRKVVEIGLLKLATIPQVMVKCLDTGLKRPANPPQVIAEVMEVGLV